MEQRSATPTQSPRYATNVADGHVQAAQPARQRPPAPPSHHLGLVAQLVDQLRDGRHAHAAAALGRLLHAQHAQPRRHVHAQRLPPRPPRAQVPCARSALALPGRRRMASPQSASIQSCTEPVTAGAEVPAIPAARGVQRVPHQRAQSASAPAPQLACEAEGRHAARLSDQGNRWAGSACPHDPVRRRGDGLPAGRMQDAPHHPVTQRLPGTLGLPVAGARLGRQLFDRLTLGLHNVGQRGIARLIKAQVRSHHRRQPQPQRRQPAVHLPPAARAPVPNDMTLASMAPVRVGYRVTCSNRPPLPAATVGESTARRPLAVLASPVSPTDLGKGGWERLGGAQLRSVAGASAAQACRPYTMLPTAHAVLARGTRGGMQSDNQPASTAPHARAGPSTSERHATQAPAWRPT